MGPEHYNGHYWVLCYCLKHLAPSRHLIQCHILAVLIFKYLLYIFFSDFQSYVCSLAILCLQTLSTQLLKMLFLSLMQVFLQQ